MASQIIGRYQIIAEIARGGMGVVYRVRAPDGSEKALKLMSASHAFSERVARFERERELLSELGSEAGFVPVIDAGTSPLGPWIVMPFLGGGTLRARLGRGPWPIDEVVDLARDLARALGRAHAHGIVHRDLKPENVLFQGPGLAAPFIADLGLAKHFGPEDGRASIVSLSISGEARGTYGYMPPEQLHDAKNAGPPANVFALGAILYECLSGRAALAGDSAVEIAFKTHEVNIEPLAKLRPDTPKWLLRLVERALASDPLKRPRDGGAFRAELDQGREHGPRAPIMLVAGLGLGLALAVAFGMTRPSAPVPPAPVPVRVPVPVPAPPVTPADPAPTTSSTMTAHLWIGVSYPEGGDRLELDAPLVLAFPRPEDEQAFREASGQINRTETYASGLRRLEKLEGELRASVPELPLARAVAVVKSKHVGRELETELARRVVDTVPASVSGHLILAWIELGRGDSKSATRLTQRALDLAPSSRTARVLMAVAAAKLGRMEDLVAALSPLVDTDVPDSGVVRFLAEATRAKGKPDAAIPTLERAAKGAGARPMIRRALAENLVAAKRWPEALAVVEETIRTGDVGGEPWRAAATRGKVLAALGRTEEARAALEEARAAAPESNRAAIEDEERKLPPR